MALKHRAARSQPSRPRRRGRFLPDPTTEQRLFEVLSNPLCAREISELLRALPRPEGGSSRKALTRG